MKITPLKTLIRFHRAMTDGRLDDALKMMPASIRRKVEEECARLDAEAPPPEKWEPDPAKRRTVDRLK